MSSSGKINVNESLLASKVLAFLRSPSAEVIYRKFELPPWFGYLATFVMIPVSMVKIVSIVWTLAGVKNLVNALTLKHVQQCRCKERKNPELFMPLIAHGVITGNGVGLVLGTFEKSANHDALAELALRLSGIYRNGPTSKNEEEIHLILRDDAYRPSRRRKLPNSYNGIKSPVLFDVMLNATDGKPTPLSSVLYAFVAQNEDKGDTEQIPWSVVDGAVRM
jgi:hypothetical protein